MERTGASATDERMRLGRRGEQLAAVHLEQLGFEVLARNERTRYGEIDLVACDGETIVFAEVKTRRARARGRAGTGAAPAFACELGWPAARQRRRLRKLALAWLSDRAGSRPRAPSVRFDLIRVSIARGEQLVALEHLPGAL